MIPRKRGEGKKAADYRRRTGLYYIYKQQTTGEETDRATAHAYQQQTAIPERKGMAVCLFIVIKTACHESTCGG